MIIQKFKATSNTQMGIYSATGLIKLCKVRSGWWYYSFDTPEQTWIRHSGKLTNEEKQMVIKWELENNI